MDRRAFLSAASAVVASAAGCGGVLGSRDADHDVGMTASAFRPARVEAAVDEAVVWKNTSGRAHTVTAYGALLPDGGAYFASGGFETEAAARKGYGDGLGGAIYSGESYEHAFGSPGEYPYFCVPHERAGMVGRVVVR